MCKHVHQKFIKSKAEQVQSDMFDPCEFSQMSDKHQFTQTGSPSTTIHWFRANEGS